MNTNLRNILILLAEGVPPKNLNKYEISILEDSYGKNWFEHLCFNENIYEKPSIA